MRLLRDLGWWVRDYAYALVWQARALVDRTDPDSFLSGDRLPIVVLPGVYETWQFLRPLIAAVHRRGHPVHVVPVLRSNRLPVREAADLVTAYLESRGVRKCVVLAHSKGGLVGKQIMLDDAAERIVGMVAVATPFGGSRYGRMMLVPTLRVFSPRSATIRDLSGATGVDARIVSVFARLDPHIPEGSALAGAAKNVMLETGGHFRILADPRVIAEVLALAAPPR